MNGSFPDLEVFRSSEVYLGINQHGVCGIRHYIVVIEQIMDGSTYGWYGETVRYVNTWSEKTGTRKSTYISWVGEDILSVVQ